MNKHLFFGMIGLLLLIPSPTSAQDITRDWDKTYDFSKVKTFAVQIGTRWGNQLSEDRIQKDVTDTFIEKGWQQAPEASANVIVVLHGSTQTKRDMNTFYSGGYGAWGYRGWGVGGAGTSTTTVNEYRVGTLLVDLFDAMSKKLVYRGTASDELSKDPQRNEKKGEKAVDKLFKDFPPGSKS